MMGKWKNQSFSHNQQLNADVVIIEKDIKSIWNAPATIISVDICSPIKFNETCRVQQRISKDKNIGERNGERKLNARCSKHKVRQVVNIILLKNISFLSPSFWRARTQFISCFLLMNHAVSRDMRCAIKIINYLFSHVLIR